MEKIQMQTPIVEMNGDEMTRIIWSMVKEMLIEPYIDLNSVYFNLGQENVQGTDGGVIIEACEAVKKFGVGVKCASVNSAKTRSSICKALHGAAVFKMPLAISGIKKNIPGWKEPVTIARETAGISQEQEANEKIRDYAFCCFDFALNEKKNLWLCTRENAGVYKDTFDEVYNQEFKESFAHAGITYTFLPAAESSGWALRSDGGYIWAMKNYDSDILSGFIAGAFSMPAMMINTISSTLGKYVIEPAHSTGQRLFSMHMNGQETSANSVATIFAWTKALRLRGKLDNNSALVKWADDIEKSVNACVQNGFITRDMAQYTECAETHILNTYDFIKQVKAFYDGNAEPVKETVTEKATAAAPTFKVQQKKEEPDMEALYEAFFDERSYKKKREILRQIGGNLTDKMITDFAVSLDVVVEDGNWETRYMSLMNALNQMCRFETEGLR